MMMNEIMNYEGFAVKSIGASHVQKNIVCQDSVQYCQDLQTVTAAVSDGHGSKQYFRSHIGSDFAANLSCRFLSDFLHTVPLLQLSVQEQQKQISSLIHRIVSEWRLRIRQHLEENPFTAEEQQLSPVPEHAYGATLVCLGICKEFGIGLHIGDGKCVAIYPNCNIDEPIPWDERCHLNRCTSICDEKAEQEFRYCIWKENKPVAVFAASDGIDDSFAERLHEFYLTFALDLSKQDFRECTEELQKKLFSVSERGSQDDMSVCGLVNIRMLKEMEQPLRERIQRMEYHALLTEYQQKLTDLEFQYQKAERSSSDMTEKKEQLATEIQEIKQKMTEFENVLGTPALVDDEE